MKVVRLYWVVAILLATCMHAYDLSDALRINGYANLYTLHTDNEAREENEKYLDTSGGIQARYQLSDDLSLTAQVYFEEQEGTTRNDAFDVEAKWLYADYYLGHDWTFRAGLFQFPIFTASETGTIGYTLTWTETPLDNYGANGYEDFVGVELLKRYFYGDAEFLVQLSYGLSENDLPTNRQGETVEGETDSLVGVTFKSVYDWLSLNVGYLQATSEISNFPTGPSTTSTEKIDFQMIAVEGQVDWNDWSIKSGYMQVWLSEFFPDELKYYASLEYRYQDFTPYIYYAKEAFLFDTSVSGPSNPLDEIMLNTYSVGTRYDMNDYMAIKFSWQYKVHEHHYTSSNRESRENIFKAVINVLF